MAGGWRNAAGGEPSSPEGLAPAAWAALGEVLRRDLLLLAATEREKLLSRWEEVARRERALEDRLFLGLIGGTGVGKSTLINAIAGSRISRTGDRRPTTSRVVVYRHRTSALPADFPRADLSEPEAVHGEAGLERTVVFDFPDFDSVEADHAAVLGRFLPRLDVLLVVVDDEKYADQRLFDVLRAVPQAARNVHFVLNKVDLLEERYPGRWRGVADEILEDLAGKLEAHLGLSPPRERLVALSAQAAWRRRSGDGTDGGAARPEGDFPAVLELLEGYRAEKRRRAAKEANLEALKAALVRSVREAALDPGKEARARALRETLEDRRRELEALLASIEPEAVGPRELRRLSRAALGQAAARLGFPLGWLWAVRRMRKEASGPTAAELTALARAHYHPYREALRAARSELAEEATAVMGTRPEGSGAPAAPAPAADFLPAPDPGEELLRDLRSRMSRALAGRRLRAHFVPVLLVLLAAWSILHPVILRVVEDLANRTPVDWWAAFRQALAALVGALSPSGIFLLVALLVLAYALVAALDARRVRLAVDGAVGAFEEAARERARAEGEAALGAVEEPLAAWERERREIAAVLEGSAKET